MTRKFWLFFFLVLGLAIAGQVMMVPADNQGGAEPPGPGVLSNLVGLAILCALLYALVQAIRWLLNRPKKL